MSAPYEPARTGIFDGVFHVDSDLPQKRTAAPILDDLERPANPPDFRECGLMSWIGTDRPTGWELDR